MPRFPLFRGLPICALLAACVATPVPAQVQQSGNVTPGHVAEWATRGVIQDGGTATQGILNSVGIYGNGGTPFCITNSGQPAPFVGAYTQFCLGASQSAVYLTDTSFGGATHIPLQIIVNGNVVATATDTGFSGGPGNAPGGSQFSTQYNTGSGTFGGTGPGTAGQVLTSNGAASAPTFQASSGSFSATVGGQTVTNGSTTTNQGTGGLIQLSTGSFTNGHCVQFDATGNTIDAGGACTTGGGGGTVASATANNVAYYATTGTTVSGIANGTTGQFLKSNGSGSAPSWAAVTATPGGTSGQIQFNNSGALGGFTASGDATINTSTGVVTVTDVNKVFYPASPSLATVPVVTSTSLGGTVTYETVPVGAGGTGLTSGTSGGIPYFSSSSAITSSAALTANAVLLGGGTGASPTVVSSLGTSGQVLTSAGSGSPPTWSSASGTITGVTPGTNISGGGTSGNVTVSVNSSLVSISSVNFTGGASLTQTGSNIFINTNILPNAGAPGSSTLGTTGSSGNGFGAYYISDGGAVSEASTGLAVIGYAAATPAVVMGNTTQVNQSFNIFEPRTDNAFTLGASGNRWTTVFATTGTINTSDQRFKKTIKGSLQGLGFILCLRPKAYQWTDGPDELTHQGLYAQQVLSCLKEENQGTVFVPKDPSAERYGLNYSELTAPLIAAVQDITAIIGFLILWVIGLTIWVFKQSRDIRAILKDREYA